MREPTTTPTPTLERSTDRVERDASRFSTTLVVAALAYGAVTQGAFHARQYVVFLVLCALVCGAALGRRQHEKRQGVEGSAPWAAAASLVVGATVVGLLHGSLTGVLPALSLAIVVLAGLLGGSASSGAGRAVRAGLVIVGVAVAATVWAGVALHREPWGKVIAGIWRGAGSITYVNATAALLSMALLVSLAELVDTPGRRARLIAWALVVGLVTTLSRAGLAAALVGVVVLAFLLGGRRVAVALIGLVPAVVVSVAALVPSMPEARAPQLAVALTGLVIGAVLAATEHSIRRSLVLAGALVVASTLFLSVSSAGRAALDDVGATRVGLESTDRSHQWGLALDRAAGAPFSGHDRIGAPYQWQGDDGRWFVAPYAHNEYLDLLAAYGLVGALAVVAAVALVARGWRHTAARTSGRPPAYRAGAAAALAAFAVHSAFDFLWHIPMLVLAAAILAGAGLVTPDPLHRLSAKEPT